MTDSPSTTDANLEVGRKAYDFARDRYAADFDYKMEPVEAPPRMVINGNQALCLGALLSGCRFMSAYPMTPATSIIEWMSAHAARYGIVTKHTEDEIAAIDLTPSLREPLTCRSIPSPWPWPLERPLSPVPGLAT